MTDRSGRIVVKLVSDSTGETVAKAVEAAANLFADIDLVREPFAFVNSAERVDQVVTTIAAPSDIVVYTIADRALAARLKAGAERAGAQVIPLLDPVVAALAEIGGARQIAQPGRQHEIDDRYFRRMEAIDFAISQDDGLSARRLHQADVILIGASRTSKTPTCIYLGYQGVRAANVPLLPGQPVPAPLIEAQAAGVPLVGLIVGASRLAHIRAARIDALGGAPETAYTDPGQIREELAETRLIFDRLDIPVIDVTRRSIEETAAAIQAILRQHRRPPP
ncbi:MAG: pyruvate, water dikinase regulatory protein [Pseudomonadota bacterium]